MKIIDEPLPGAFLLQPRVHEDRRGIFVKTFSAEEFRGLAIDFSPVEEFYSISHRGVLRGMHFQIPPNDHAKLVYCIRGRVLDVLLDLRKRSTRYGQFITADLSAQNRHQFFIPKGIAHGFLALEDDTQMVYQTSTSHVPSHDFGVRWDSFGLSWGVSQPTVSDRDQRFPRLDEYLSPFD